MILNCIYKFWFLFYLELSLWCRWSGDRFFILVIDVDFVDLGFDKII